MSKFPAKLLVLLAVPCLLVLAYVALKRQEGLWWEGMLAGPFYGTNYPGEIVGKPLSSLELPGGGSLQVYRLSHSGPLVIAHRLAASNAWARVLLAEQIAANGSKHQTEIREFELQSVRKSRSGYKVLVFGYWVPGGKERGLILLGNDLSFQAFYLDW